MGALIHVKQLSWSDASSDEGVARRWPAMLLAVAICASAATILILTRNLTFLRDDWQILLRPGLSAHSVFSPHNEHIVVGLVGRGFL